MNHQNVGKKKSGDRKKRLSKRERVERDSKVKVVRPLFLSALSSRMAYRISGTVLSKENIQRTEKAIAGEYQDLLETEIRGAINVQSSNLEAEDDFSMEENTENTNIKEDSPAKYLTNSKENTNIKEDSPAKDLTNSKKQPVHIDIRENAELS